MKHVALLLCLLGSLFTAQAATQWQDRYTVKYDSGNLSLPTTWNPELGLHLNLRTPDGGTHLQVILHPDNGGVWLGNKPLELEPQGASWLGRVFGKKGPSGEPVPSLITYLDRLPSKTLGNASMAIKFRYDRWTVYLEDRPILVLPPPFKADFTVSQLLHEIPEDTGSDVRFQKVGPYVFAADFMIPEDDPNKLGPWKPERGEWKVHSALDDALEQKTSTRLTARPLEAERSSNFFCLAGSGEQSIITTGYKFLDDYSMQASVLLHKGESGLVFYYQDADNYYEYTMTVADKRADSVILKLRRHSANRIPRIAVLAAVEVGVTADQWVMPRVEARDDRITCYLDQVQVMEVAEDLPVGGRFGLSVDAEEEIRFDDVKVESISQLALHNRDWIAFHNRGGHGEFLSGNTASWLASSVSGSAPSENAIEPPFDKTPKWIFLGSPENDPHVFQATFRPHAETGEFGIIAGYGGDEQPYLRFVREASEQYERFSLFQIQGGQQVQLETWRRPWAEKPKAEAQIRLMADPSEAGFLRLYSNDELVLVHDLDKPLAGGSGLYVGPQTGVRISGVDYRLKRQNLFVNQLEKNQIYVTDPYMRHWSSPEGQWIQDADGLLWNKGDFLGRFVLHLPYTTPATAHLGVEEGWTTGAVTVALDGLDLTVFQGDKQLTAGSIPADAWSVGERAAYAIHYEDRLLWATDVHGKEILKTHLDAPLKGHRVRLEGFTYDSLMYSHVEMYHLVDNLFSEAPHEWTINGGQWQVINRFQCDPRWSHFNGQNGEGLAALWSKYRYSGDFCVELYAGMRHGANWYARAGDLNITMMNTDHTVGQGYTVRTSAWDRNESQLWTYFHKNGEILDRSGKYLVPRRREGNVRIFNNPLLGTGRPIHGAWYYLKLRRVDKTVQFFFDNEKIFEYEDDEPIEAGSMGIWTFAQSMMVARVRVAAEHIEPAPLAIKPLPLNSRGPQDELPFDVDTVTALTNHEVPLLQTLPSNWTNGDTVAHGQLDWHVDKRLEPYFTFTNVLGAGNMATQGTMDPVPLKDIAGWRFKIKRTAGAAINFHYELGRMEGDTFKAYNRYFHRLSGTDFSLGECRMDGSTEIPAVKATSDRRAWHEQGDWQTVDVIVPFNRISDPWNSAWVVKVEGFGELQLSPNLMGMTTNQPGDSYAIKGFAPILRRAPELGVKEGGLRLASFVLIDSKSGKTLAGGADLSTIQNWVNDQSYPGLHQAILRVALASGSGIQQDVVWVADPGKFEVTLLWDEVLPNALQLKSMTAFPSRHTDVALLEVNGIPVNLEDREPGVRVGFVPRDPELLKADGFTAIVSTGSNSLVKYMRWAGDGEQASPGSRQGNRVHESPVLVKLDGATVLYQNLEERRVPEGLVTATTNSKVEGGDPVQANYLHTYNTQLKQRLAVSFNVPFSLAKYPLLQFRYRATEQADISLNYGNYYYVLMSEKPFYAARAGKNYAAHEVRYGTPLAKDEAWHSWTGMISDAPAREPLNYNLLASNKISFSSFNKEDQTGQYSSVDYDDIVLGPAVRSAEQLAFTPTYFDPDGIAKVLVAVRNGELAFVDLSEDERMQLVWQEFKPGSEITPDLTGLKEGIGHLCVKAVDGRGSISPVTDIPFLYDTKPAVTKHAIHSWAEPASNGVALHATFESDGQSPLDLSQLAFAVDGKSVNVKTHLAEVLHAEKAQTLVLDYPHIFKERIDKMKDGESFDLTISGIVDGAGNTSKDHVVPIKVDYAADKNGPAWLPAKLPKNMLYATEWQGLKDPKTDLKPARGNTVDVVHARGEEPFLRTAAYHATGNVSAKLSWQLEEYPYFSFRMKKSAETDDVPTQVNITLAAKKGDQLLLSLTIPRSSGRYLEVEELGWTPDVWQTVTLNVYEQAVQKLGRYEANRYIIRDITIARTGTVHQEPLDIQGLFVFGPWKKEHKIMLDAYDASGISGVDWEVLDTDGELLKKGSVDGLEIVPATLTDERLPGSWLLLYARDPLGNRSVPMRLPFPGKVDQAAHDIEKELEK